LFYSKKKKKRKKKEKKGTPPWYVNVGGHPMKSVSHVLRKEKRWGGVPSFIKEHKSANLSLSKTCFIFEWKIVRTLLPVVDKDNHLSKPNLYLSVLQMKSSSTCLNHCFPLQRAFLLLLC
jgi:hypothetical protein